MRRLYIRLSTLREAWHRPAIRKATTWSSEDWFPYKRADLAVAGCARLGRRVKVAGAGRFLPAVRASAGPGAEFLGAVNDTELQALLGGARALIFAGEEDFGIVPVEAQAAGVPVIAYGTGGVRDTVVNGVTGVFFDEQTIDSCASGILAFKDIEESFNERVIAWLRSALDVRGDMSMIGPCPKRLECVELFRQDLDRYADRHRVKSGITGWAQVHGLRGHTSLSKRVEWDSFYIENRSCGWTSRSCC